MNPRSEVGLGEALAPRLSVRLDPRSGSASELARGRPLRMWLSRHMQAAVRPIFPDVERYLEQRPHSAGGNEALMRLLLWHRIYLRDNDFVPQLYRDLQQLKGIVEEVCVVPRAEPPPSRQHIGPPTRTQFFRENSPRGVGANAAASLPGGDGAGVGFADVEAGWGLRRQRFYHPNLQDLQVLYGGQPNCLSYADHGTRVVGVICATPQGESVGVRGLAPACSPILLLGNRWQGGDGADFQTTDDQLGQALMELPAGSVVLLQAQTVEAGDSRQNSPVPAEFDASVYDAVVACVRNGLTVVAAAGNGGRALEEVRLPGGGSAFDRQARDSGAILVAAGWWEQGHWERHHGSNYGDRIDCFAEGSGVVTTALGAQPEAAPRLTDNFSGTSASAAIIGGVALSLQGMARKQRGRCLRPSALRRLVSNPDYGTAHPGIGVMPDLRPLSTQIPDLPEEYFLPASSA